MRKLLILGMAFALSGCAFADTLVWDANGIDQFGTLNVRTGEFTQVSDLGFIPAGLGEIGQNVYTAEWGSVNLLAVNTYNGTTSVIGTSSISFATLGSTTTSLYTIDSSGGLWSINPTNGQSSYIGSTLLPIGDNTIGLSTGSNTLYMALGSAVYTIDTVTAQASLLGGSGSDSFGALVGVRNVIYAGSIIEPNALYAMNPTTGGSTFVSAIGSPGYAWGLAPVVPEPGSFALLGAAGILVALYSLRRKLGLAKPIPALAERM